MKGKKLDYMLARTKCVWCEKVFDPGDKKCCYSVPDTVYGLSSKGHLVPLVRRGWYCGYACIGKALRTVKWFNEDMHKKKVKGGKKHGSNRVPQGKV